MPQGRLLLAEWVLDDRARPGEGKLQVHLLAPPPAPEMLAPNPVEAALAAIDPDKLSPREALEALYLLKGAARKA